MAATHSASNAKPVRTPQRGWVRYEVPEQRQIILSNSKRPVAIRMSVGPDPGEEMELSGMLKKLGFDGSYKITRPFPEETLRSGNIRRGFNFRLPSGRTGFYAATLSRRKSGEEVVVSYVSTGPANVDASVEDFLAVRAFNNQLRRGATPGELPPKKEKIDFAVVPPAIPSSSETLPPQPAQEMSQSPSLARIEPVAEASPVKVPPSPMTSQVAVAAKKPAPSSSAGAALMVPKVQSPPGPALPISRGIDQKQISTLLYAPMEASEVYVLFKDGSFHETLPRALEDWDAVGSRQAEPDSWGKWKRAKTDGQYELRYGPDDMVTISAVQVQPAAPGTKLEGKYAPEASTNSGDPNNVWSFASNNFELRSSRGPANGWYKIEGYTISLFYTDGKVERRPFLMLPPEEPEEAPSIWFGSELLVKL